MVDTGFAVLKFFLHSLSYRFQMLGDLMFVKFAANSCDFCLFQLPYCLHLLGLNVQLFFYGVATCAGKNFLAEFRLGVGFCAYF